MEAPIEAEEENSKEIIIENDFYIKEMQSSCCEIIEASGK